MSQNDPELKLLLRELKDPYKRLHFVFLLISIIPFLSCLYILFGKTFISEKSLSELMPVLLFSNLILILGYVAGYKAVTNIIQKILAYATRAKRLEEQRSSLAAALAHDLKSPLAVIKANMFNLKTGVPDPPTLQQEKTAALCMEVTDRMASILMGLIKTYTLGDESSSEPSLSRFDLREIIEEQLREFSAVSQAKNLDIKSLISKPVLPVNADRSMITRAVNNLLNNAVKHTPSGGKITVKTAGVEGFAQLEILNTGQPIPRDKLGKIFENYERLDPSVEGQGLGLAIARAIIEAHQGKVWAESGAGQPNCFTLLLPLGK